MKRAIIITLTGLAYFIISVTLFVPLRMKPVVNYNLFMFPAFAAAFLFLFYKTCACASENRAYIYAFFAGLLMWQTLGELASLRVTDGLVRQFSDVNIKTVGGYLYVLAGWILLFIAWKTRVIKEPLAFCLMTFIGIWNVELYLDNYTAKVPVKLMPVVADCLAFAAALAGALALYAAKKASSLNRQTVLGGVLYLMVSIILMAFSQFQKPQIFYLKHEGVVLEQEIKDLQEELAYMAELNRQIGTKDAMSVTNQLGIGK
jgi:hypothetical protein